MKIKTGNKEYGEFSNIGEALRFALNNGEILSAESLTIGDVTAKPEVPQPETGKKGK